MDFTETLGEIMDFCESNNVTSYYELKAYAFDHDKDDWISVLKISHRILVTSVMS